MWEECTLQGQIELEYACLTPCSSKQTSVCLLALNKKGKISSKIKIRLRIWMNQTHRHSPALCRSLDNRELTTIVCSPRDFDCRWPSRLGMFVTVIRMNSFNASHSDWNAVLTGISTLLQSMHQNISAVHFSVKWEWKSEDSQQRKVHWLHLLFTQNRKSCSHFALLIFRRQMEQLVSILEPAVI